jgi:hypothetical protein
LLLLDLEELAVFSLCGADDDDDDDVSQVEIRHRSSARYCGELALQKKEEKRRRKAQKEGSEITANIL